MSQCQEPTCRRNSSETYSGKHGNTLELCPKHYYELVSGKSSGRPSRPVAAGGVVERKVSEGLGDELGLDFDSVQGPLLRVEKLGEEGG